MIGKIEGIVSLTKAPFVILSAGGVGYRIAVTREVLHSLKIKESAALWTHLAVRENALDLYGFRDEESLGFFELLLTVSGIGPKSALAILDVASVEVLRNAIAAGNATYLTKVSGIGKKTAEKIVVELKEKVGPSADTPEVLAGDEEALEALRALGYSADEARNVLRKVPRSIESASARVREALRIIGG